MDKLLNKANSATPEDKKRALVEVCKRHNITQVWTDNPAPFGIEKDYHYAFTTEDNEINRQAESDILRVLCPKVDDDDFGINSEFAWVIQYTPNEPLHSNIFKDVEKLNMKLLYTREDGVLFG